MQKTSEHTLYVDFLLRPLHTEHLRKTAAEIKFESLPNYIHSELISRSTDVGNLEN